jgi:hypothetical protein
MKTIRALAGGLALVAAVALAAGCGGRDGTSPRATGSPKDDHSHGAGPHGGPIADWGGGKYHVEFTVSHPKKEARVYVLGSDAKKAAPVKADGGELTLSVTGVKDKDKFEVTLKAEPQKGDPEGTASCFVGTHDKLGVVQEFEGTVSGKVGGKAYSGDFKEEPEKK